ncbi:MAG: sterol desaturase/sphingolipid hydroxylase (fatty acid hydroxylase superfamily) [Gammaproteobacteria bacterium]|jgi:sterol desaturase/sphingolipid hydroxylase (fatty acid hydroxylase superfamily)
MDLSEWILINEVPIRLVCFFCIFTVMAIWEILLPRRQLIVSKGVRWVNNLGLVIINSVILRLLFPAAAVGVASLAESQQWGLMNYYQLPLSLSIVLTIVVMDFVIYLQHVMFHAVPLLWRIHRVHHADLDYDVTTGARFHPIEILLSMLIKFLTILVLGPAVIAVVIFEVVLNVAALFNHSNVRLPLMVDKILRWIVVTPDMHRVHHSIEDDEANSNFGFNLPWWDRLFATYKDQPRAGHEAMVIGIHHFRDAKQVDQLPGMLALPFIDTISEYAINRRTWDKPD